MRPNFVSLLFLVVGLLYSPFSSAFNLQFLENRPISYMSAAAYEEFKAVLIQALENEADGYVLNWESAKEKSSAKVVLLNSYTLDNRRCRKFKADLRADNRQGRTILHICKDEIWRLTGSPLSGFSKADWAILSREVDYTLAEVSDGIPNSWIIPDKGISGTLVPVKSEYHDPGFCRSMSVSIHFPSGELVDDVVRFCREADGHWKRRPEWREQN